MNIGFRFSKHGNLVYEHNNKCTTTIYLMYHRIVLNSSYEIGQVFMNILNKYGYRNERVFTIVSKKEQQEFMNDIVSNMILYKLIGETND